MRLVLAVLLIAGMTLTGCVRDFEEQAPENRVFIQDVEVSAPVVRTGSLVLSVNTTLDNRLAESGPLHVVVKAFDANTGFLVRTERTANRTLGEDKTVNVEVRLDLPRRSGYRLEVEVYQDGRLVETGQLSVRNVDALEPTEHQTGLSISTLEFLVRNVTENRVRIQTQVYLTNEGSETSRELRMQLKARDIETGLLADEVWTSVETIPAEETRILTADLLVPDAHNYEVEAALWDGNLTVERGRDTVQLLPTITKSTDEEIVVTDPRIEDFIREGGRDEVSRGDEGFAADRSAQETPGPGALVALGAVLVAALAATRRRWT